MRLSRALSLTIALSCSPASAQTPPVETCQLGELKLESGEVIRDFRMTYMTLGKLNEQKSNAILSIHGLQGNRTSQTQWAGPGRAFDTNRYFVIQPDTLGVASVEPEATTSPTRSGLNMSFPRFNIRDMVRAEHRMLTECLGIKRLVAVSGSSMGGIEALQWAVSFPDFMEAVIPFVPMARANRQGNFIWEAVRQVVMVDPKWRDGAYPNDDPPRAGIGVGLQIQSVVGWSAAGFEDGFRTREQVHAAFAKDAKATGERVQARDWIYRSWAIQSHDISQPAFKGDLAAAARSIRARVLLFPNCQDQLHPPREGGVLEVAQHIPVAKLVDINDSGGHRWTQSPGGPRAMVTQEIRDLLDRVADGRPGIAGPRFPRSWSRTDFCPG